MADDVTQFVSTALGWTGTSCQCSAAVALSFEGQSSASVAPAGASTPAAGIAGHTGDAVSVSVSAHGPATATATSGAAAGTDTASSPRISSRSAALLSPTPLQLATAARSLVGHLVEANGGTVFGTDPASALPNGIIDVLEHVSVDVALSTGAGGTCGTGDRCAAAISVSLNGAAKATILPPNHCAGAAGAVFAVAVSVQADANARARQGQGGGCATAAVRGAALVAAAGDTGSVIGMSVAVDGSAVSAATSGDLGSSSSRLAGPAPSAGVVALSGSSGDATGVAIGRHSASASVHSGRSGDATAICAKCADAQDGSARAVSGDTGLSFSVAGAGLDATASARSGDTGTADATARGATVTVRDVQRAYHGDQVDGQSGNTGDAIAEAVDLSTWVRVDTDSGATGLVSSVILGPQATKSGPRGPRAGSTVAPSAPGHRRIATGRLEHSSTVGAGSSGVSQRTEASTPVRTAAPSAPAPNHSRPAPASPARSSSAQHAPRDRVGTAAAQAADLSFKQGSLLAQRSSSTALFGVATGLLVFAVLVVLSVLSWLRRGRSRR